MGRPSNRRWSAQRPGKRARARVKNSKYRFGVRRGGTYFDLPGAGTVYVKAGRKKGVRLAIGIARIHTATHLAGKRSDCESRSQVIDGQDK